MKISLGSVTLMKPGRANFMMKLGCHMSFTPGLRWMSQFALQLMCLIYWCLEKKYFIVWFKCAATVALSIDQLYVCASIWDKLSVERPSITEFMQRVFTRVQDWLVKMTQFAPAGRCCYCSIWTQKATFFSVDSNTKVSQYSLFINIYLFIICKQYINCKCVIIL